MATQIVAELKVVQRIKRAREPSNPAHSGRLAVRIKHNILGVDFRTFRTVESTFAIPVVVFHVVSDAIELIAFICSFVAHRFAGKGIMGDRLPGGGRTIWRR